MSAQVDVLDTMHDCAMRLRSKKCDLFAADLDAARAAVAALIAERDALRETLKLARDELGGLPRSLGYEFTHLPKIDAALAITTGESA